MHCSCNRGKKDICSCVDNAKGPSSSRLHVALTKTLTISTVTDSSICSYVLFVGLSNNSSRFE